MESIAIYYENIIINWNSILISFATLVGFFIGLAFYRYANKYAFAYFVFFPIALILSVFSSRILHWYCHIEQYDSFKTAVSDLTTPGFLLPAVIISVWFTALILSPILNNRSRYSLLDPFAPALAFIIAIIKFSNIFSDSCLGKAIINNPLFQHFPFAKAITDSNGNTEYRFATFYITSLCMLLITFMLIIFYLNNYKHNFKVPVKKSGHVFRMFLVLYGGLEIVMDSTRYDASHLYFPGEALASLNKGAGFMGLSQFLGALFLLYAFIFYLIMSIKSNGKIKKHILSWILFIVGLGIGGFSEYLVQRYSGMYLIWYSLQSSGVIMMIISIYLLYKSCIDTENNNS